MSRGGNINEESLPGVVVREAPTFEAEMTAFDELGPLTRQAILDFPVKMLAWYMRRQCAQNGWDPKSPTHDRHIERCIRAQAAEMPRVVPDDFRCDVTIEAEARAARVAAVVNRAQGAQH